jgi:hypothetical protein
MVDEKDLEELFGIQDSKDRYTKLHHVLKL